MKLSDFIPTKISLRMSPELILLLPIAIMADAAGLILLCFGLDDFGLLDLVLDPLFLIWIALRKKDPTVFKKILFRALGYETLELIPYVSDIFPGYTLLVIMTVMDSQKARDQEVEQKNEEAAMASMQAAEAPGTANPS
jgi:hypothetical protein